MKILEFLEDPMGKLSGLRIAILVWIISICFNSIYLSIINKQLVGADPSMVTGLGILIGSKVAQNFTENKAVEILEKSKTQD